MKSLLQLILCLFLCFSAWCQPKAIEVNNNKPLLNKIFSNKNDVDFEFSIAGRSPSSFKYYIRNDSLWVYGTNLYSTVVPLSYIDFERQIYFLESSLWKTKTNDKCIEVGLHAIKGKKFGQDFEISAFKDRFEDAEIDFVNLILPDKAFAEDLIKYLKAKRP